MDFKQLVSIPTQKHGCTLDLVISNHLNITITSKMDLALSDHQSIFFNSFNNINFITKENISKCYNTPEVHMDLSSLITNDSNSIKPSSCEDLVFQFTNEIHSVFDAVAPIKTKIVTTKRRIQGNNAHNMQIQKESRAAEHK